MRPILHFPHEPCTTDRPQMAPIRLKSAEAFLPVGLAAGLLVRVLV